MSKLGSNIFVFFITLFIFLPNFVLFISTKHVIILLYMIILFLLLDILNKYFYIFLSAVTIFLTTVFSHIYTHWGFNGISSRLQAAMLSPAEESIGYLRSYLDLRDGFLLVYAILGYFLLYLIFKRKFSYEKKTKSLSLVAIVFLITPLILLKNPLKDVLPFNLPYLYYKSSDWVNKALDRKNYIKSSISEIKKYKKSFYKNIIIVIGESASKHHMSAYGYTEETTPFFDTLKNNKSAFFANAISPANQTRFAIPAELTNINIQHFNDFFTSYSLVSVLRANGYNTSWISNQAKVGVYDTYVTTIADEANLTYIANQNFGSSQPDSILIPHLKKTIPGNSKKNAVFIHLMGSHFQYKDRYPNKNLLNDNPRSIIEEYDNSIHYTDNILKRIFSYYKKQKEPFLFIYFSDHSELVTLEKHGHGFLPPEKEAYDIPLLIYSSIDNPRIDILRKLNQHKTINASSIYNIVLFLNGYEDNLSNLNLSDIVCAAEPKHLYHYNSIKSYKANLTEKGNNAR